MEIVQLRNVYKCFCDGVKQERKVLRGVDLSLEEGSFAAVMGVSGAGKSTLLNVLGLLCEVDEGEYRLQGERVSLASENVLEVRNRAIGFIYQDARLLPHLTAWQNVLLPVLASQREVDARHEAWAEELMQLTGVEEVKDQLPDTLSGGEKARVALCRALVMRPVLLLADEPTGQLDEATACGIGELLRQVNERWGTTMLVVTHDAKLARVATRCYRLENGVLRDLTV